MTRWQDEAERLLELARRAEPSVQDAEQIRSALRARYLADPALFAAQAANLTSAQATLGGTIKASLGKVLASVGIGAALGGVTVGVATQTIDTRTEPTPIHSAAPVRIPPSGATKTPPQRATVPVAEAPKAPAASTGQSRTAVNRALTKSERQEAVAMEDVPQPPVIEPEHNLEVALLKRAQQHLHRGEWAACLGVVREIDERVPRGAFQEEVEATRAIAQCMAQGASVGVAHEFLRRFPGSVHTARIQSACGERTDAR